MRALPNTLNSRDAPAVDPRQHSVDGCSGSPEDGTLLGSLFEFRRPSVVDTAPGGVILEFCRTSMFIGPSTIDVGDVPAGALFDFGREPLRPSVGDTAARSCSVTLADGCVGAAPRAHRHDRLSGGLLVAASPSEVVALLRHCRHWQQPCLV